ncbi:hypothetical protein ACWET9_46905 [Streptomyces sp. NPDC004059]
MADGIEADQFAVQAANPQREIETEAGTFLADFSDSAGVDTQSQGECCGRPSGTRQVGQQPGRFSGAGQARGAGFATGGDLDTEYGVGGGASDVPHLVLLWDAEQSADLMGICESPHPVLRMAPELLALIPQACTC